MKFLCGFYGCEQMKQQKHNEEGVFENKSIQKILNDNLRKKWIWSNRQQINQRN